MIQHYKKYVYIVCLCLCMHTQYAHVESEAINRKIPAWVQYVAGDVACGIGLTSLLTLFFAQDKDLFVSMGVGTIMTVAAAAGKQGERYIRKRDDVGKLGFSMGLASILVLSKFFERIGNSGG